MNPTQYKAYYEEKILTLLLEKYENSRAAVGESGRRPQFRLLKCPLAVDYTDELDVEKREGIHAAAQALERQGMIFIIWERHGTGHMERILLAVDAELLYQRMGRMMPLARVEEYRTALVALSDVQTPWVQRFCTEAGNILAEKKLPAFLPKEKALREHLIRAILALPRADEDIIPKRVFSQRVFGDSKYFERAIEAALLVLLRRFTEEPCESDAEYLDMAGIGGHQGKVWVAGEMLFSLHGRTYALADFSGGMGLTHETIAAMKIEKLPHSILTVENLTNAEALARSTGEKRLLIYTAGFPNRTAQAFLAKIADARTSSVIQHWGDLDYGGIRIFEYLHAQFFSDLKPYRMDAETFRSYFPFAQELNAAQRKRLTGLLEREDFAAWHELIRLMLDAGKWVEQEVMLWEG